jgi:hypothetical protein
VVAVVVGLARRQDQVKVLADGNGVHVRVIGPLSGFDEDPDRPVVSAPGRELLASSQAEPEDRASPTSGSGIRTVDVLLLYGEH